MPRYAVDDAKFLARLNRDLRAVVHEVRRLTPTIVEVVLRAPVAARRFEPGQFYRMQNFEALRARSAGHDARDGRPRAHRRLGGPRKGPDLGDRARDGRLGRPARLPAARRAGDPDGPDRHADRDSARRDRGAGGRRPRQRGALLHRPRAARRAAPRSSTSPATGISRTATASTTSRPPPTWWSGAATKRPDSRRGGRRTAAFVGNIVQAMLAYASGALGAQPIPYSATDRIIAIGSDRMMAAVAQARHGVLKKYPQGKARRHRLDQQPDAMHDERDLRAMPAAARRSGNRQDDLRVLLLQPGPAARPGGLRRPSPSAWRRTACRRS